jgi:catalase
MSDASIGDAGAPDLGEVVPPGEAEALDQIVRAIEAKVREAARHGPARRDAHPKAHGCVRAEFRVLDDVPPGLRAGVFAEPGRSFEAWIRFSNGAEKPGPDAKGDGRGMAIKLLGVEGSPSGTQDFLLIDHPVFFVRDAADYAEFQTAPSLWQFFAPGLNPFALRLREALIVRAITRQEVRNPLSARYWSMTPYACGGLACKFSARPLPPFSRHTAAEGPDFLRDNLARHLAEAEARFEFLVQPRTDADAMPV